MLFRYFIYGVVCADVPELQFGMSWTSEEPGLLKSLLARKALWNWNL